MIARLMGLRTLSPAALRERMRTGQVAIFDTNRPRDWASAHVPGATHLDPVDGSWPEGHIRGRAASFTMLALLRGFS